MPRIRTLKPEHKQHRKVGTLDDFSYRLWVGMVTEADDEGRLVADPAWLRAVVFPWHPRVTVDKINVAVTEIAHRGLIRLYLVDGVRYADFPSWRDHQYIQRPGKSIYPDFTNSCEQSLSYNGLIPEASDINHGGRKEGWKDRKGGMEGVGGGAHDEGKSGAANGPAQESDPAPKQDVTFHIPASVAHALDRAPILGQAQRLRDPSWWQAELRANPSVDLAKEVLKAEAWITSNPQRAPRKDHASFMHRWFAKAQSERA